MWKNLGWAAGIAIATFFSRVYNLLDIPIFTDEAIYIRWAQIGLDDPQHRFISLTDGKQPLLTWMMYPWLKVFEDPLFAGRFVSVLSGVGAAVGLFFLGKELFNRKVGIISSLLYIISPFFLIYDRLALMDSLQASLGIWSLYLSVLLVRRIRLDIALLLGMVTGLGYLTKSSALFYLLLLPVSLLLFHWEKPHRVTRLFTWAGLSLISTGIAQVMYNSLRLSPWFYLIKQKDHTFIITTGEFLSHPFADFEGHLHGMTLMAVEYITYPVIAVIIAGIIWGIWKMDRRVLYLFLCFLFPFLSLAVFAKIIFPRYLLFMVVPLVVIAAQSVFLAWSYLRKKYSWAVVCILALFLYPLYQSSLLLVSPVKASIPSTDRNQLFDDWPSGYGVNDVISFLKEQSKTQKVVIGTEGTFGLFPAAIEMYLQKNPNVEIHGYWPVGSIPDELMESARHHPTYLVFKETQNVPNFLPLKLIAKIPRGVGRTFLLFYQVIPPRF